MRAFAENGVGSFVKEVRRSHLEGFSGGARNAIEKSCEDEGEDGVTIIAGRGDFSVARGRERSGWRLRVVYYTTEK